jgi:methylated-DNA-protein-cysteine methyltransferase-like protein
MKSMQPQITTAAAMRYMATVIGGPSVGVGQSRCVDRRRACTKRIQPRQRRAQGGSGHKLAVLDQHTDFGTITGMGRAAGIEGHAAILRRVLAIPPGFVRTYGDVSPGAPRLAGYVLSKTGAREVPWHRVVRADGSLAKGARQRRLLEDEGVPFHGERVVLSRARLDDLDAA